MKINTLYNKRTNREHGSVASANEYWHLADGTLSDPKGPLVRTISLNVLAEGNREVEIVLNFV